jgi:hypothetical protein
MKHENEQLSMQINQLIEEKECYENILQEIASLIH